MRRRPAVAGRASQPDPRLIAMLRRGLAPRFFLVRDASIRTKAADRARLCARMSANIRLRVPGATVSVDPTPPDGRATRYGGCGLVALAAPCPPPTKRWSDSTQPATNRSIDRFESRLRTDVGRPAARWAPCGAVGE